MRRHALGIFAIAFLVAAGVRLYKIGVDDAQASMMTSVFLRVGLVLGAAWLAWPQLKQLAQRVPPWLMAVAFLALIIVMMRPRYILVLAPILAALAVLQFVGWLFRPLPRPNRPGPRRNDVHEKE